MIEERIKSKAFQHATLRSEAYRITGLLCLLGGVTVGAIARNLAAGQLRLLYTQTLALALALGYEIFALVTVKKALRSEREVPRSIWLINILIDAGLPTLGLFVLIESRFTGPYEAPVAPAVFLY